MSGEVTSPNYPNGYPRGLQKTERIEVESGSILSLGFTFFDVWPDPRCGDNFSRFDNVKIIDGDGTILMNSTCGQMQDPKKGDFQLMPVLKSRTNAVEIIFTTDLMSDDSKGWSLNWTTVTPGWYLAELSHYRAVLVGTWMTPRVRVSTRAAESARRGFINSEGYHR